ncbi:MAG: M56 family metallopeptidase, partial [Hominenteromicrobium sp.]
MDTLIFMTVSASLLLSAAFVLRALFGRVLPRRAFMALWCAASVRLLVPLEIALPVSVFALFARRKPVAQTVQIPSVPVTTMAPVATAPPTAAPVATAAPAVVPAAEPLQFADVLPWIWAAGAVLLASALLFVHLRERYRCRFMMRDFEAEALVPRRVRVYRCAAVSAPYVTGLFRPQILLPAGFDKADLPPVLAHELAHIRGLDILKKMLFAAALCVNWFNPLVWVMVRLAGRDLELLCDERALRAADAPARTAYAHALLNAEERRSVFTLGFQSDTEVRIMTILNGKKHS